MIKDHPNVALLKRLDLHDLPRSAELFADNVVWHYANPNLPDLCGDHVGLAGIGAFFQSLKHRSGGTFKVTPRAILPVGDELVVVHSHNTLTLKGRRIAIDVVVVWRIVQGKITEVWDIVPGDAKEIPHD